MQNRCLWPIRCAVAAALVAGFIVCMFPFAKGCRNLYDNMLRLHVIANSDTAADQQLKLQVRDALLTHGAAYLDGCADADEAAKRIEPHFPELTAIAKQTLRQHGCSDDVHITLERTYFGTRTYGQWTTPAGFYRAVCVRIGKGAGRNWWCVMYPPLCLPAAADTAPDAVFDASGKAVLGSTPQIDVRFKVVEWVQSARARLRVRDEKN